MTSTPAGQIFAQVYFCTFFYIALVGGCFPPVPTFLRQSRFFEPVAKVEIRDDSHQLVLYFYSDLRYYLILAEYCKRE